jgi:tRNA (mo5U34)-methyltransferase
MESYDKQMSLRQSVAPLHDRVHAISWWHRIDLGSGIITPGPDDTPAKIAAAHLPADLTGKTVIDVGAWDGAFSFECERRGAEVLATDHYIWQQRGSAGFDLAHEALHSRVKSKVIKVEDLSPSTVGTFDIVLFLGVLYHSQDPMLYLRNVASICREQVIVETHIDALDYPRPAAVFYPAATLNNDSSNFWGPNPACVESMLLEVGFRKTKRFESWLHSRMFFHAWK